MLDCKSYLLQFFFALAFVSVHGQPLPDTVRAQYDAAKTDSKKGQVLVHYLQPFRDDSSFFTKAKQLRAYFMSKEDEAGQDYVQLVANDQLAITGDYATSLNQSFRLLSKFELKKDAFGILQCHKIISIAYAYSTDADNSIRYCKKTVQLALESGDTEQLAAAYNNLGSDFYVFNMPDSGLQYAILAVRYARQADDNRLLPMALGTLAENYIGLKRYDTALVLLAQSLPLAYKSNLVMATWALNDFAQIYLETGRQDSSRYYSHLAVRLAQEKNYRDQLLRAFQYLSSAFEQQGQKDSAFYYLKRAVNTKDSLFSSQKLKQLQAVNFSEQMRLQELQQEKQRLQNKIRLYALVAGLLIFSIIAVILFRNNRQKQKVNSMLADTLTNLKAAQSQLIQSEKMSSLGELTAGIAHEIQNPLNFVNNFSDLNRELIDELEAEISKGDYEEAKAIAKDIRGNEEKINHHGRRADSIVKGMLQHSSSKAGTKEPTDINALADEYLRLSYHGIRAKDKSFNATLNTDFDPAVGMVDIVPQDIGRVLLNILNNAFYALAEKMKSGANGYVPTVGLTTAKVNQKIEIRINDNGNGIPEKIAGKVFQPFFTTKPTGQGTGLGLSLAYDIVKAHGGDIEAKNIPEGGAEFIITLQT